jgi:hypothetical protein
VKALSLLFALVSSVALAQGLPLKSGAGSDLATVDSEKNLRVSQGNSTRPTYIASASGIATTALYNLTIEAPNTQGLKLVSWCVGVSNATAAAAVSVQVSRRTTASSAGTQLVNEAAGNAVTRMDPGDAAFGGIVRLTGTLGTAGAMLDQHSFTIGEQGAGTADVPGLPVFCRTYGLSGEKLPTVVAGVNNGITINVSTNGAGALASGSISATFIQE